MGGVAWVTAGSEVTRHWTLGEESRGPVNIARLRIAASASFQRARCLGIAYHTYLAVGMIVLGTDAPALFALL